MKIRSLYQVFLCLLFTTVGYGQATLHEALPTDPAVRIGKLSNGLTYFIRQNSRPENKVELRLVVNAGSILEDPDQRGLAHFTEHMAFNGSKHFKKNDIISFLQTIGVEFGADLNAYTGFDETVYILPIPTEKKENVEKAFQILEDWAHAISFDTEEINKERGIVLEEERLGKGADERIFRITFPKILEGSRYAERLPIGKAEVISSFKPEAIKRFYNDWYRPDMMAVIVAGDIDPGYAEALIKQHFEKLENPAKKRERAFGSVPVREKSEGLVVTDREATNHVVEIYYSFNKDEQIKTLGDYRRMMVKSLSRYMLNQRLQELTQKAEPPFLYAANSVSNWVRGYEGFYSIAYVGREGPQAAINALIQENERARQFGFTDSELERTKKIMLKNMERRFNERDKTESYVFAGEYIDYFLQDEPIPGIENEYRYYKMFLEGITVGEVNKIASETIPSKTVHKLAILTGPDSASFTMPANEELLALVENAEVLEVTPYEDRSVGSALMAELPKAGEIVSEKVNELLGTQELQFSNGIRVLLKPTDFKNDQIVMTASRFGGQYLFDPADRLNAEFSSVLISQMGLGEYTPFDLRKLLAGKSVSVSTRIGNISESVSGQCSTEDAETMFQLTHLYFTRPRKDAELFKSFVNKQQTFYQNMMHDPEYIFQDSLLRLLYGNHPWAPRLPSANSFEKINLDRTFSIYNERFSNAQGFNFVIVGRFETDSIKKFVEVYLGSLPSRGQTSAYKDVGLRPVKGVIKKEITKGQAPKSLIRMIWNGEKSFSQTEQLKLQALSEIMNIRITETLREDLSGVYGGGMNASLNKFPYQHYSVSVTLPCGPENVAKLISATLEEIERMKKQGPLQADLDKVKETWRQQYRVNIRENSYWARQLLQSYELDADPSRIVNFENFVNVLTVKDVQGAAQTYLDMQNYVEAVLNPEQ